MRILCAYPTAKEADPLPAEFPAVEFLELGVGKAASAASLTRRLCTGPAPELLLLFGICGAYRTSGLAVGDACLVTEDCLADEGVQTDSGFMDLAQLELCDSLAYTMDPAFTKQAEVILPGAALVRGATVSICSGTDFSAASLARRTGAQIETMEGAAVALVCARAGLPMIQLRCVSNLAGDRERGGWDIPSATSGVRTGVARLIMEWQL